jgi:hypothetical protein
VRHSSDANGRACFLYQLFRTGHITSVRFSFAFFGVNERYREVSPTKMHSAISSRPFCQYFRQVFGDRVPLALIVSNKD